MSRFFPSASGRYFSPYPLLQGEINRTRYTDVHVYAAAFSCSEKKGEEGGTGVRGRKGLGMEKGEKNRTDPLPK